MRCDVDREEERLPEEVMLGLGSAERTAGSEGERESEE